MKSEEYVRSYPSWFVILHMCQYILSANVLVCNHRRADSSLTIQLDHRRLTLSSSSTNLDKHEDPSSSHLPLLFTNQIPGSVNLLEDMPTYSQWGPMQSLCASAKLKSSWISCCLGASLPWWPWLILASHSKPVSIIVWRLLVSAASTNPERKA